MDLDRDGAAPTHVFAESDYRFGTGTLRIRVEDIKDWNPNNDAVLQLWTCSGGANQKWRRS